MSTTILLVDNGQTWHHQLRSQLIELNYRVITSASGGEALQQFSQHQIDLVILDLHMHGMNGIDACRELRKRSIVPIVLLADFSTPKIIVKALEPGADDLIPKSTDIKEVVTRLRALLRRCQRWQQEIYRIGDVVLNDKTREVTVHGRVVNLRPKEYELLHYLITRPQQPVSKSVLSEEIWGCKRYSSNAVEMTVRRLREKIERDPSQPKHLITLRGAGYVLGAATA